RPLRPEAMHPPAPPAPPPQRIPLAAAWRPAAPAPACRPVLWLAASARASAVRAAARPRRTPAPARPPGQAARSSGAGGAGAGPWTVGQAPWWRGVRAARAQRQGCARRSRATGRDQRWPPAGAAAPVPPASAARGGSCLKPPTQAVHRIAEPRFHRLPADPGDASDLLQWQLAMQAQQDCLPLFRWQFVHRPVQARGFLVPAGMALGFVAGSQCRGALVGVQRRRRAVLLRPPVVGQAVVGDAVQPGTERRVRSPAIARRDHPLPDVLEQLLGQGAVAYVALQETEQRQAVARVKRLERGGVAAGPGLHQGVVAGWVSRLVHAQHPSLAVARCTPPRGRRAAQWQGGGQAHARYNARAGEKGSSGTGAGAMLAAAVKVSTEPMTPIRRLEAAASAAGMRVPVAQDRLHAALRELLPEADWIAAGWRCPDAPGMAE